MRNQYLFVLPLLWVTALGATAWAGVDVSVDGNRFQLGLTGGAPFHDTANRVSAARTIAVPDSPAVLVLWNESTPGGTLPFYAISLDGQRVDRVREANYDIMLRAAQFEPLKAVPSVAADLGTGGNVFIVQFVTQPLPEFTSQVEQLGGQIYQFLPNYAYLVHMDAATRAAVAELPYVRWVGAYQPGYRVEEILRDNRANLEELFPFQRYNIMVFESGLKQKHAVAERIRAIGGLVNTVDAGKFLLHATLTPEQLWQVVTWDEVHFVDRWGPYGKDMDNARIYGGANYIETAAGYDGYGVRGEVFDAGFNISHGDFASRPLIQHGSCGSDSHGAATSGIVFGDGTGDATARGLLPAGQGIIGDYNTIGLTGPSRYQHTAEQVQAPYYCVFETASVGSPQVSTYTSDSADTDAALFDFDILHCQSQSNTGSTLSRPQAWAKNILSGGGIYHYDSLDPVGDCWCGGASTGPASDNRIKPDLCAYYDAIRTTTTGGTTSYTPSFGGTSGATPIIAGHCGLFFQMWADGIFGNEVDPGGSVFDNRPHMTTAKAVMINNAVQYPYTTDLSRIHQGWGWPNLQNIYDRREKMFIVNETEVLQQLQSISYALSVDVNEPEFKATLVYADPPGSPTASMARINDLTLRVTSPDGQVYWGNYGLLNGNYSTPGGAANTVDTVENVFVQNPASGMWVVEVFADEINEDSHLESPEVDADFALVVSGVTPCSSAGSVRLNRSMFACEGTAEVRVLDCDLNTDPETIETITITVTSDSEPAGEPVLLTETGAATAAFRGSLSVSATDAPGVLWVADGNIVTATYLDADDGQGHYDILRTATAMVDCLSPEVFDVEAREVQPRSAIIAFEANEPVSSLVFYGLSCGALFDQVGVPTLSYTPSVTLTGIQDNTTYYFAVQATDAAGNSVYDDNGGACYTFTTPEVPDYFTELFASGNDLDFVSLLFEPNDSNDFYFGCVEAITELPTDPGTGTPLAIAEDQYVQVQITGGRSVSLYGNDYTSFWVSDNGYITFGAGDGEWTETLAAHFDLPRISALFDDFSVDNPPGAVTWQQFDDRVVVSYVNVPEYSTSSSNTFQIEMYFDGRLTISYLQMDAADGLAGLSQGLGVPPGFLATDLSTMGACYPLNLSLPSGAPELIPPDEPTTIRVRVRNGSEAYVPDSGTLHYSYDGVTYETAPLVHVSGDLFDATLPPPSCADHPAFFISAEGSAGSTIYYPLDGPANPLRASVGVIIVLLDDNFQSDLGWTVWNDASLATGAWQRVIPLSSGTYGAPLADYDGSGRCYVTDNRAGESGDFDVDGGPTVLTSPVFDASGAADLVLKYARWFDCGVDILPPAMDYLNSEVSSDAGATWVRMQHLGPFDGWIYDTLHIADYVPLTSQMQIRFSTMDRPNNSTTEAGIDAVLINYIDCSDGGFSAGDLNCDGLLNAFDIDPFVLALTDQAAYSQMYEDCDYMLADCSGDGSVNAFDIDPFVTLLTGG